MTCSLLFSIGSMVASNVNPWPDVVFMTCRPFALEEIEQSSHALLLKTKGGYCRSFFQGSLFSTAAPTKPERLDAISDTSKAVDADKLPSSDGLRCLSSSLAFSVEKIDWRGAISLCEWSQESAPSETEISPQPRCHPSQGAES